MPYATIPGFEQMTAQQVFDLSVNHLRKQNARSTDGNGTCVYRGRDGRQCAAGPFLRDSSIPRISMLENSGWRILRDLDIVPEVHYELVLSLQRTHDRGESDYWEKTWEETARDYELVYTPVDAQ